MWRKPFNFLPLQKQCECRYSIFFEHEVVNIIHILQRKISLATKSLTLILRAPGCSQIHARLQERGVIFNPLTLTSCATESQVKQIRHKED